jgi:hypothetical protein
MKVRASSYILAGLFTFFGLWCLVVISRFLQMFSEMQSEFPFFTRAVFAPTGVGWFLVSLLLAVLVIWKDLRPRPWLRTPVFVIMLSVEILNKL